MELISHFSQRELTDSVSVTARVKTQPETASGLGLRLSEGASQALKLRRKVRTLLLFAQSAEAETFSYQIGWPAHFQQHGSFDCVPVNLLDRGLAARVRGHLLARGRRYDAIVLLHSVFSNSRFISEWMVDALAAAPQPKAYFLGNEYKLMPEKLAVCESLGVNLLVTMNPSPLAQDMYRQRLGCAVVSIPSGGLDKNLFRPTVPRPDRPIDIGYRANDSPPYLGHDERKQIAEYFLQRGQRYGLRVDISLEPRERHRLAQWASFLNQCKGQLGSEAGGDYFELTDSLRNAVNDHLREHPQASMQQVYDKFFKGYRNPIPVRTISGRHVEAAGTKTVQVLFEGQYSGYLHPDLHYIPLKKDFSNADEAIAKFRDEAFCRRITDAAHAVAMEELTYEKLIEKFYHSFKGFL